MKIYEVDSSLLSLSQIFTFFPSAYNIYSFPLQGRQLSTRHVRLNNDLMIFHVCIRSGGDSSWFKYSHYMPTAYSTDNGSTQWQYRDMIIIVNIHIQKVWNGTVIDWQQCSNVVRGKFWAMLPRRGRVLLIRPKAVSKSIALHLLQSILIFLFYEIIISNYHFTTLWSTCFIH